MADEHVDPTRFKIFPRNLTARADYIVRGNPTNSRPESGVDNCFPGLEFDQRNLDQQFFPGLRFEFQRADGAVLTDIRLDPQGLARGLSVSDLTARPLYLWFLYGRTRVDDPEPTLFAFRGQPGIEVWRRVHDLLPGRLAIMLGPSPAFSVTSGPMAGFSGGFVPTGPLHALEKAYAAGNEEDRCFVVRDDAGGVQYAVFSDDRARYLDPDGVIDPDVYAPGELTKTMCAPWMYDFRDCYCFYWASNKPDIVDSADGQYHDLNFIRKDCSIPPPRDVSKWIGRRDTELTYADMVEGWWHRLPVVLNDRETPAPAVVPPALLYEPLSRGQAVSELAYLATVEHALAVEYLYALHSVTVPVATLGEKEDEVARRLLFASTQLRQIAIDEMRHFAWVNTLLHLLGARPSTGRAEWIGEPPTQSTGRKLSPGKRYLQRRFALAPLTEETLQWFIDVEAPSQVMNEGLDGMYVDLLRSIADQPGVFPEHERLVPIVKLIIDEGEGHHRRFLAVRDALAGIPPERYLRMLDATPTDRQKQYLTLCDQYYASILDAIEIGFTLNERARGELMAMSIRSMHDLADLARTLAVHDVGLRFTLPRPRPGPDPIRTPAEARPVLEEREAAIRERLEILASGDDAEESRQASRHLASTRQLFGQMQALVREQAGRT
jgi:hypothetical protein